MFFIRSQDTAPIDWLPAKFLIIKSYITWLELAMNGKDCTDKFFLNEAIEFSDENLLNTSFTQ